MMPGRQEGSHFVRIGTSLFGFLCECMFFESERAEVCFTLFKVRIALIALFVKSGGAISSSHSF